LNPNQKNYPDYGGRGISMCSEWLDDFAQFRRDMGPRPIGYSLERIDNDGHYEPRNCRWANRGEQNRNTRRNRPLTLNGETLLLTQWAERLGITSQSLTKRLTRGWSVEAALTAESRTDQTRVTNHYLEHDGQRRCVTEWARITGIGHGTIYARIKMGWTIAKALTTPVHC
jgi:hypothetical protein